MEEQKEMILFHCPVAWLEDEAAWQQENVHLAMVHTEAQQVRLLADTESVTLLHSPTAISKTVLQELVDLNDHLKLEFESPNKIYIQMLTPEMISTFTLAIGAILFLWNRKNKNGRVYDATARYDLIVKQGEQESKQSRAPDFSYVAFSQKAREELNEARFIESAPTLCGEIVSHESQLNASIKKMQDTWMAADTKIGIVVCPYRQLYYVFDHSTTYQSYSFAKSFSHSAFPELEINFQELLDEVKQ